MVVYSNGSGIDTAFANTVTRDRAFGAPTEPLLTHTSIAVLHTLNPCGPTAVSYTHLTLPTICSV
eukprot:1383658-Alexandrium_andersonii.AAC.1